MNPATISAKLVLRPCYKIMMLSNSAQPDNLVKSVFRCPSAFTLTCVKLSDVCDSKHQLNSPAQANRHVANYCSLVCGRK